MFFIYLFIRIVHSYGISISLQRAPSCRIISKMIMRYLSFATLSSLFRHFVYNYFEKSAPLQSQ